LFVAADMALTVPPLSNGEVAGRTEVPPTKRRGRALRARGM